jgi:hypothetical protein
MKSSTSTYTSICDKCGKTLTDQQGYPPLRSLYLDDYRGSYASADPHRHFMDLCSVCFDDMLKYLGAEERWKKITEEAQRYRSY